MDDQNQQLPQDQTTQQPDVTSQTIDQTKQAMQQVKDEFYTKEIPQEVRIYLEGILDEADIFIVDEEDKEQILHDMYGQLDQFLTGKILEAIPEEKIDSLADMVENPADNQAKLQEYLTQVIPNTGDYLAQAFEEFRNLYLDTLAIEEARFDAMEQQDKDAAKIDALENVAAGNIPLTKEA